MIEHSDGRTRYATNWAGWLALLTRRYQAQKHALADVRPNENGYYAQSNKSFAGMAETMGLVMGRLEGIQTGQISPNSTKT